MIVWYQIMVWTGTLLLIGASFFLYVAYSGSVAADPSISGNRQILISIRDEPILVYIADSPEERQLGLSNVSSLAKNEGMLFVFEREGDYSFWMKETLIPLDMIWINNNLEVVHIESEVRPETYPSIYSSPVPARFVLEVNAFFTSNYNIAVGDRVLIPKEYLPLDLHN